MSGTLTLEVMARAARCSTNAATVHGGTPRPSARRWSAAARTVRIRAPRKLTKNYQLLLIAVLRAWFSRPEARVQAADLLREPGATVGAVARQVGYGTPFALSTAFKRARAGSARRRHPAGGCR